MLHFVQEKSISISWLFSKSTPLPPLHPSKETETIFLVQPNFAFITGT